MAIAANKIDGIRAANVESDLGARLSRQHNDSNVICLGSRILAPEYAKEILKTWLNTAFEGGRHEKRIRKITDLEKK
jgi:ribose 5-phosphate isomerase B